MPEFFSRLRQWVAEGDPEFQRRKKMEQELEEVRRQIKDEEAYVANVETFRRSGDTAVTADYQSGTETPLQASRRHLQELKARQQQLEEELNPSAKAV